MLPYFNSFQKPLKKKYKNQLLLFKKLIVLKKELVSSSNSVFNLLDLAQLIKLIKFKFPSILLHNVLNLNIDSHDLFIQRSSFLSYYFYNLIPYQKLLEYSIIKKQLRFFIIHDLLLNKSYLNWFYDGYRFYFFPFFTQLSRKQYLMKKLNFKKLLINFNKYMYIFNLTNRLQVLDDSKVTAVLKTKAEKFTYISCLNIYNCFFYQVELIHIQYLFKL